MSGHLDRARARQGSPSMSSALIGAEVQSQPRHDRVAAASRNLARANRARQATAADRDVDVAVAAMRVLSADESHARSEQRRGWLAICIVRVAWPDATWSQLARRLGVSRDTAAARFRRVRIAYERGKL
jgi:DNA-binding transcriptional regulator WhiA